MIEKTTIKYVNSMFQKTTIRLQDKNLLQYLQYVSWLISALHCCAFLPFLLLLRGEFCLHKFTTGMCWPHLTPGCIQHCMCACTCTVCLCVSLYMCVRACGCEYERLCMHEALCKHTIFSTLLFEAPFMRNERAFILSMAAGSINTSTHKYNYTNIITLVSSIDFYSSKTEKLKL